jgi:hypothetical protein
MNTASQDTSGRGNFAIFARGFRPFFFGAAIWAVIAIGIWVDMLLTGVALPSRFHPLTSHIHEMLFGFVMAAVAGFLLAAIPNWTKSLPISAKAGLTLLQPSPGTAQRTIRCQPAVELKLPESDLNYWKYDTPKGVFSIVERASRGVDAYFGQILVAHYASPVQAAEEISGGRHHQLACAPDDGKSLGVPGAVHEWTFVRT